MLDNILYEINNIWSIGLVRFVVYIVLAFVVAKVASALVAKVLKLAKLDQKLDKWGINEGVAGTSMKFVEKLVYLLVFLCFIPSALEAIGVNSLAYPIDNFISTCIGYIPNVIAAVVLVYVGVLIAKILGQVVCVLLKKTKLDSLIKRADTSGNSPVLLSELLSQILTGALVLLVIVAALGVLNIDAISSPAISIVHSIFSAIPGIILAVIVVAVGMLVAGLACTLLTNVLVAVNFDGTVKKILPQLKSSATKIVVNLVRAIIVIFVAAQGIQALNLSFLSMIVVDIVAYLPVIIKAAAIALAAVIGANLVEASVAKICPKGAKAAKAGVFTLAGFMIFSQLGIAPQIVNTAFKVAIIAVGVAAALAFGLGGKDYAKKLLEKLDKDQDGK